MGLKKIFRVIKDVEVAAVVDDAELLASKLILDAWNQADKVVRGDVSCVRDAASTLRLT